jgi:hypothetical protein
MSPESVTIETFREIAHHQNGHAAHVHVAAAPSVAAQIEFWWDGELQSLKERVGKPIDVRVDPAVHPERPLVTWDDGMPDLPPIRVGDEYEVDLLAARLPVATSAAAVVNGRLIEVENAANAAGQAIKVRILDVDGSEIIAEPRYPLAAGVSPIDGERKKRRRRGGRGRKPLTAAEQQEELRELAEEAAKGLGARPALGISTTEEASAEDQVATNSGVPNHPAPAAADVAADDRLAPAPLARPGRRDRPGRTDRTDRADRGARSAPPPAPLPAPPPAAAANGAFVKLPGESLSGAMVAKLPGETLSGDRVNERLTVAPVAVAVAVAPAAAAVAFEIDEADDLADEALAAVAAENGTGKRRRRRRRRGRGGDGEAVAAAPSATAVADEIADESDEDDGDDAVAAATPPQPGEIVELDGRKKRRRRRRRRGRGGSVLGDAGVTAAPAESTALPDRHIIRVDGEGGAHPTGETAPPEPNRSIAPWKRPKKGEVALEGPPPSLTAPVEPAPDMKVAAPTRRRRTTTRPAAPEPPAPIESVAVKALPAPARAVGAKRPAGTRATSAKKAPAAKATAKKAAAKKTVAVKKTAAKKTATAKKATAAKKAPAKKAAAKKAPAKKAAAKKTSTRTPA